MHNAARFALALALSVAAAGLVLAASVKVTVDYDKAFDFSTVRTFAWHPNGAGEVKLLEKVGDKPEELLARFAPVISGAVENELTKRGWSAGKEGATDVYLKYYVLIGPNSDSQYQGQFIGAVPAWGLPDYAMSTTALKIYEQGTLVLDMLLVKDGRPLWRGIARAELQRQRTPEERDQRLQDAVAQLLKKFPPKFQKK